MFYHSSNNINNLFLPSGTIRIRGICCARHFDDGGTRREHVCIILYVDLFNFRIDKKSVMTLSVQQKQKTHKKNETKDDFYKLFIFSKSGFLGSSFHTQLNSRG